MFETPAYWKHKTFTCSYFWAFLVGQIQNNDIRMPAKIKVRIVAARDLPVMDRSSDLADAFAEVRNFLKINN